MRPLATVLPVLLALTGACEDPVSLEQAAPATYALLSINGDSLPYLFSDQGGLRFELVSRDLTLRDDRSSVAISRYREITATDTSFVETGDAGDWSVAAEELRIKFSSGRDWKGTLSAGTLRLVDGQGHLYVFRSE